MCTGCDTPTILDEGQVLDFPNQEKTQDVPGVSMHTPLPRKAVMGVPQFLLEHSPSASTCSPSLHKVPTQILKASRRTGAEARAALSSLLSPSGKISLSFIKQNPYSKFTQTDPLSILLPGEWTLRTEVILFTFPRHH